jgi:serine protease Do
MKAVKLLGGAAVLVGLVAVAAVYAPVALGQVVVAGRADRGPDVQVWSLGGSGQIGATIRDVDPADVEREKLPGQWGAAIEEVRSDSPAERAGFKAGDVLIEFDGERVRSARQLTRLVQETPEGRTVKAAVVRAGRRIDVDITPERSSGVTYLGDTGRMVERLNRDLRSELGELGELSRLREFNFAVPFDFAGRLRTPRLGIQAQEMTDQLAKHLGADDGVLVTSVDPGSIAEKAGLKAGDVITALDGASVGDVSDLRRRLGRLDDGEDFTIAIVRDRQPVTLNGKMDIVERDERVRSRVVRRIVS